MRDAFDLRVLADNVPGGVFCCGFARDLPLIQYSNGFLRMFGYTREEIAERFDNRFAEMIYPPDLGKAWADADEQLARGDTKEIEYRVRCRDGSVVWVLDKGQLMQDESGERYFYCILINITDAKRAQEELRLSLERHQIIMDQTTDIIFEWDIRADTFLFSGKWRKKFGYDPVTTRVSERLPRSRIHPDDKKQAAGIAEAIMGGQRYAEAELRLARERGEYLWCRVRITAQFGVDGAPVKAVGVIIDIDDEKKRSLRLRKQAERDALTGLYNRGAAQSLAERVLRGDKEGQHAVMVVDIDNFKMYNDTFGHLCGDEILVEIGARLRGLFRESDVVGRIGGDEFFVMMRGILRPADAAARAERMLREIADLLHDKMAARRVSCSVGIAVSPRDGQDFRTLYRNADAALYEAKRSGKNRYAFYESGMKLGEERPEFEGPDGLVWKLDDGGTV